MHSSSAHARNLVCGHADTDARAANRDTEIGLTCSYCSAYRRPVIGIVNSVLTVGPKVYNCEPSGPQVLGDLVLQMNSSVISTNSDSHGVLTAFRVDAFDVALGVVGLVHIT